MLMFMFIFQPMNLKVTSVKSTYQTHALTLTFVKTTAHVTTRLGATHAFVLPLEASAI